MIFKPGITPLSLRSSLIDQCLDGLHVREGEPITLIVPTKRAVYNFTEAFKSLDFSKRPKSIMHLFDVDSDTPFLTKPPVPFLEEVQRIGLLSQLLDKAYPDLHIDTRFRLSRSIAELFDDIYKHNYCLQELEILLKNAPRVQAEHWEKRTSFLTLLTHHWPTILKAEERVEPWAHIYEQLRLLDLSKHRYTYFIGFKEHEKVTVILKEKIEKDSTGTNGLIYYPHVEVDSFVLSIPNDSLRCIEYENDLEEAYHLANKCEQWLKNRKDKSVFTIITRSERFAHQVKGTLDQKNISVNTPFTQTLPQSVTGSFVLLTAQVLAYPTDDQHWLALAQHPLCFKGQRRYKFLQTLRHFDIENLRGKENAPWHTLFNHYESLKTNSYTSLKEIMDEHEAFMNDLCGPTLWHNNDGETAGDIFFALREYASHYPYIQIKDYDHFLRIMMRGKKVFYHRNITAPVHIIAPNDAPYEQLNEVHITQMNRSWDPQVIKNPWLPYYIQDSMGLTDKETHQDALLCFHGKHIEVSRSRMEKNEGTRPSILWNYLTLKKDVNTPAPERVNLERNISIPSVSPPYEVRVKRFSPSSFELFIRNPYVYYGKYILQLKPLRPYGYEFDAFERGRLIHSILDGYTKKYKNFSHPQALCVLETMLKDALRYMTVDVRVYWMERMRRVFEWVVRKSCELESMVTISEKRLEAFHNDYKLIGILDRYDKTKTHHHIIDYKTGIPPSKITVEKGFAPQLPFLVYLLTHYEVPAECIKISYWHLHESTPKIVEFEGDILLKAFIPFFEDALNYYENGVYRSSFYFSYKDYEHFERRGLWS